MCLQEYVADFTLTLHRMCSPHCSDCTGRGSYKCCGKISLKNSLSYIRVIIAGCYYLVTAVRIVVKFYIHVSGFGTLVSLPYADTCTLYIHNSPEVETPALLCMGDLNSAR